MRLATLTIIVLISACPLPCAIAAPASGDDRPNILLIVADDLGYADLGSYGSDIATPNIDSLADAGIRFSQFHTASSCAPTRAMLLSGNNNHVAGMARQNVTGILGHDYPGYENALSGRIVPFPELLRAAGYHTYMAGKWHLGKALEDSPVSKGFERSFALLAGAADHYTSTGFGQGTSLYREDRDLVDWPRGAYSTELYTDRILEYLESSRADGNPFFVYAAYTSPHWPLTTPDEYRERYAGKYSEGYDALRERNFENLKAAGIIPRRSQLPPRNETITPWADLDEESRRVESREMELYAALLENLDFHVGRLLDYLDEHGLRDNTLIVFMGDNGAAGEDFYVSASLGDFLQANYDNSLQNMGRPGSFVSYGPAWAEAGSAPFSRYKGFARQGGIVAPMIVSGPGVPGGGISHEYLTVLDLAPTFLELAGTSYPHDGDARPLLGVSMSAFLRGERDRVHDDDYVTTYLLGGRAYIRKGPWKLVTLNEPFDESKFELFNLAEDPGETRDLAHAKPGIYQELLELWRTERRRLGFVLPQDL